MHGDYANLTDSTSTISYAFDDYYHAIAAVTSRDLILYRPSLSPEGQRAASAISISKLSEWWTARG